MKRWRGGFKLGRRLEGIWARGFLRRRHRWLRLGSILPNLTETNLFDWARRHLSSGSSRSGYFRLQSASAAGEKPPPKGHLAVYVGGQDGTGEEGKSKRYVVPVIYFNHPLFGELLREAEEEFGFQQPGGITIPCHVDKFERVRTLIAGRRPGSGACWSLPYY